SAIKNNDRVGLFIFTDQVESFLPLKKGRQHVLRVITELLDFRSRQTGTNLASALEYLARITRKRALVFLISDFQDKDFDLSLNIANRLHEVIPVLVEDPMEFQLPSRGLVPFEDPETGEVFLADTTSKRVRQEFEDAARRRHKRLV